MTQIPTDKLAEEMLDAYPELEAIRASSEDPVYLVGGGVRDLLLGRGRSANLDLVVEGDAVALANRLGAEVLEHERFGTATVRLGELEVDVAAARTEAYAEPGALPEVTLGAGVEDDLSRRDFTLNALAVGLDDPALIDPHGGRADLESGQLRVLHRQSFRDDPTRAPRAARYAARLGFGIEPGTEELLRETDLDTVSADRREAELLRLASEATAVRGFELLSGWGLVELAPDGLELAGRVVALLARPPWQGFAPGAPSVIRAALGPEAVGGRSAIERELAAAEPGRPSEGVELAGHRDPAELLLARARGAEWLDTYLYEWRGVALEVDGADLIEAGVPEGPAVGRGLAEALRMKLDGELDPGREQEPPLRSPPPEVTMEWRSEGETRWLEAVLPGARAAFSTRLGGVSEGPFESLNLGILTDDEPASVIENRRRLAASLGFAPERIAIGRQVHGAELQIHSGPQAPSPFSEPGAAIAEVDGQISTEPGLAALVFVADCLPVALAGPGGVAMLHCGWRGLAAGIVAKGVAAVAAGDAAIGPGIGACCYEVGDEVIEAFADLGPGISSDRRLDLAEVARRLLERAGVERVESAGLCTSCEPGLFFSHRRDRGTTGRQAGLVWLERSD